MSQQRSLAYAIKNLRAVRSVFVLMFLLGLGAASVATPASAQPFVYVTNVASNSVSVIDTATNMVIGDPVAVGKRPRGIAIVDRDP